MKHFFVLLTFIILTLSGCAAEQTNEPEKTPMDSSLFDVMEKNDREHFENFSDNPLCV